MHRHWKNLDDSSNQDMQEKAYSDWNRQVDENDGKHDRKSERIHDPHARRQDGYFSLSESVVLQQFRRFSKPDDRAFSKPPVGLTNDFHGLDSNERGGQEKSNPSAIKSQYVPSLPLHPAAQEKKTSDTGSVSQWKENKRCRKTRALVIALVGIAVVAAAVSCAVAYRFAFMSPMSPMSTRSWHIAVVEMRVNDSFQPEMYNPASPESRNFGGMFCNEVLPLLDPVLNAQKCTTTSLRPGSVVVMFHLLVNIFTETSEHLREILTGQPDSEFVYYGRMTVFRTSVQVHGLSVCQNLSECENHMTTPTSASTVKTTPVSTTETTTASTARTTLGSTPKTASTTKASTTSTSKTTPDSTTTTTPVSTTTMTTTASTIKATASTTETLRPLYAYLSGDTNLNNKQTETSTTSRPPVEPSTRKITDELTIRTSFVSTSPFPEMSRRSLQTTIAPLATKTPPSMSKSTASTIKATASTTETSTTSRPPVEPSTRKITDDLTIRTSYVSASPFPETSRRSLQATIAPLATKTPPSMSKPASTAEVSQATALATHSPISLDQEFPSSETTGPLSLITTTTQMSAVTLSSVNKLPSADSTATSEKMTTSTMSSSSGELSMELSTTETKKETMKTETPDIQSITPSISTEILNPTCDDLSEEIRENSMSLYECPVNGSYFLPNVHAFPEHCERIVFCLNGIPDNSSFTCGSGLWFLYDPNHLLGDCGFPSHRQAFCELRRRAEGCKQSLQRASDT